MDWQEEDWRYRSEVSALMLVVVFSRRRGEREREKLTEGASCEEKTERDGIERLRGMEKKRRRRREPERQR